MSKFDIIYNNLAMNVIENGIWDKDQNVRTVWADGTPAYTKSLISEKIVVDGSEVPILTCKKVAWKTAIREILRFYVELSNNVQGLKIWDEWMRHDGTIGKAYGFQLGKTIQTGKWVTNPVSGFTTPIYTNQVEKLLNSLTNDPASRRHIISLWNIDDLHDMSLYPCVWHNQWIVKGGKLYLIVGIRSNDLALGNPFNVFQYYVLWRMVAQVLGYELGTLTFNINDIHIYERHVEGLLEQVKREPFQAPTLLINPDVKNFFDFTIDDFELIDYKYHPTIKFEVAI